MEALNRRTQVGVLAEAHAAEVRSDRLKRGQTAFSNTSRQGHRGLVRVDFSGFSQREMRTYLTAALP